MALSDTLLPALVVLLSDTIWALRVECPDPGVSAQQSLRDIEALEAALMESLHEAGESVPRDTFVSLCRHAPSPRLLDALLAQQEALSYLADQATEESAAYWSEEGDGYWAIELGKAALRECWWLYRDQVQTWAETKQSALTEALEQARAALITEAACQEVKGVIEPLIQRLETYLAQMRD